MNTFKNNGPTRSTTAGIIAAISVCAVVLISSMFFSGCYYDSEEYLFSQTGSNCDTVQVTFAQSVRPVLENNCLSCHSNSTAANFGGNIKLQDYLDVKTSADNGKLSGSINHASGFIPMPQGANKMDDCKIRTIMKWIEDGALNN
jgi:hypothetical protein